MVDMKSSSGMDEHANKGNTSIVVTEETDSHDNLNINVNIGNTVSGNHRDQEKLDALAKQRDKYLNINLDNANNESIIYNNSIGIFQKVKLLSKKMVSDLDSHTEHLFYLFAIEVFFIFLTYTHYSYLDKKNRFLTPIVMGGETSLLGQTLSQLIEWTKIRSSGSASLARRFNRLLKKTASNDEEMNIPTDANIKNEDMYDVSKDYNTANNGTTTNSSERTQGNTHIRASSNVLSPIATNASNMISNLSSHWAIKADKEASLHGHLKFLTWGGVNGLLCSYWIEMLLSIFKGKKILCVLVDQSVGTVIFQTLFSLFICLWDGEIEVTLDAASAADSSENSTVDLTWDNFRSYYAGMLWKYMKLSYLLWPAISVLCFTVLKDEWIFPVNCFFSTLFGVMLGT